MHEVEEEKPLPEANDHEGQSKDDQPVKKKLKLASENSSAENDDKILAINGKLLTSDVKNSLKNHWSKKEVYNDDSNQIELFNKPFQHCVLQNFVKNTKVINELVEEIVSTIDWSRKQMDLYEFYQSEDLSGINSKYLSEFFHALKTTVMPWMEEISGVKLNRVSASCSMYNCGDYLLVHDDLLSDRQIAFIFYLSPWESVEIWKPEMGGSLEIFETDSNCLPQYPVFKKIAPQNNQFVFFKVGSKSFHQVGEVTTFNYPRLTINGWFHGEENKDVITNPIRPFVPLVFEQPNADRFDLENFIVDMYLEEKIKNAIQNHIEDNSEISLHNFFKSQKYEEILSKIKSYDDHKWKIKGPANVQYFEILDKSETDGVVEDFVKMFGSNAIFKLLHEYTDLDLFGNNAKNPQCHVEIQRWHHGFYTILGDSSSCEENTLEVTFYLNASENVGVITYLSSDNNQNSESEDSDDDDASDEGKSDDDSVLLTISPRSNNLNIVYRSKGTLKFTKFVSKNCKIPQDFVYILVASYRE